MIRYLGDRSARHVHPDRDCNGGVQHEMHVDTADQGSSESEYGLSTGREVYHGPAFHVSTDIVHR